MNLCIDFGNSSIKAARFEMRAILEFDHFKYDDIQSLKEFISNSRFDQGMFSSVVPLEIDLMEFLAERKITDIKDQSKLPVEIKYKSPKTLGADRICNAIAGHTIAKPDAVLIIDAGSCVTYDLINRHGAYLGGAISPGLNMRLKAMNTFTGKLPLAEPARELPTIGDDTISSMQVGAERGLIEEVKGMINHFSHSESKLKVILTGGDQSIFEPHLENAIFAGRNLVLEGLNEAILYSISL